MADQIGVGHRSRDEQRDQRDETKTSNFSIFYTSYNTPDEKLLKKNTRPTELASARKCVSASWQGVPLKGTRKTNSTASKKAINDPLIGWRFPLRALPPSCINSRFALRIQHELSKAPTITIFNITDSSPIYYQKKVSLCARIVHLRAPPRKGSRPLSLQAVSCEL